VPFVLVFCLTDYLKLYQRGAMAHTRPDMPAARFTRFDPGPILDSPNANEHDEMDLDDAPDILRIAIDFGTTFSSVAYTRTPASDYSITPMDIACIARYPGDRPLPMVTQAWEPRQDVPTELWYPQTPLGDRGRHNKPSLTQDEDQSDRESLPESDTSSALSVSIFEREQTPEDVLETSGSDQERSPDALAWGFEVQNQLATEDIPQDGDSRVTRFKLLLNEPGDKSQKIEQIKMDTMAGLKKLKKLKLIKSNTDVITHFLEKLFFHIKEELQQVDRLAPPVNVEFVLCVPAEWPSKACRTMQDSMAKAARSSGLGLLKDGSLDNLFIVSEPEAAAACIMAERGNDIFVRPIIMKTLRQI
jgi:hypothetical protein